MIKISSKILYDKKTKKILKCQREPFGSAGIPSFEAVCRSAKIPINKRSKVDTCLISKRISTKNAQNNYRIKEGEAIKKPKVKIKSNKYKVLKNDNDNFKIKVEIDNTLSNENFDFIEMEINNISFKINLNKNNLGYKNIKISEEGIYSIKSVDNRFKNNKIKIEVI